MQKGVNALTGISDIIRLYKNIAAVLNAADVLSVPLSVVGGANGLSGLGSVGTWGSVNGLNGLNGVNGNDGAVGVMGCNGADGLSGLDGLNGLNGFNGFGGLNGKSGLSGLIGSIARVDVGSRRGLNGARGINGSRGFYSKDDLSSAIGVVVSGGLGPDIVNVLSGLNGKCGSVCASGHSEADGFDLFNSFGGYRFDVFPFNNLTEMRSEGFSTLRNTSMKTIDQERMEQLHRISSNSQSIKNGSEIRVDMSGMRNIVNNRSDIDELIDRLSVQFCEAALSMGEGVHY